MVAEFFFCRTLQTKIDFSLSEIVDLICGVVHGSGIGPLMILTYINELTVPNTQLKLRCSVPLTKFFILQIMVTPLF